MSGDPSLETSEVVQKRDPKRKSSANTGKMSKIRQYWWLIIFPIFAVLVFGIGAMSGYQRGLDQRVQAQQSEEEQSLLEQYTLGVRDLVEGRYDLAKQRAEFILSVDPSYAEAIELLDLALVALEEPTITPTSEITPTLVLPSATPDLSSLESHLSEANAALDRGDWNAGLNLLIDLRAEHPEYQTQVVNQLMHSGLRNRGMDKILRGDLEQGIYDLTLAERFETLDNQALSWRRSAEFYIYANSNVGLDWTQAYISFSDLCGAAIWDSCFKYAMSSQGYADELILGEDPCGAMLPYEQSLITFYNEMLIPTATQASVLCMTATAPPTETPTPEITETLTPDPSFTETTPDPTELPTDTQEAPPATATPES
jgi:hypothetical protein